MKRDKAKFWFGIKKLDEFIFKRIAGGVSVFGDSWINIGLHYALDL